jgi:hypothetical protein
MELFTATVVETSHWGDTTYEVRGTGMLALDVLDWVVYPPAATDAKAAIVDAAGAPVSHAHLVATALKDATTPQAREYWTTHLIRAVWQRIAPFDRPPSAPPISDADWTKAGQWWAATVRTAPEPEILDGIRDLMTGYTKAGYNNADTVASGLIAFTEAATAPSWALDSAASPNSAAGQQTQAPRQATGIGTSLPGLLPQRRAAMPADAPAGSRP